MPKTIEHVVKTPIKGDSEEHKLVAMDWVVDQYTKEKVQLAFVGWDHEDEEGYHHFKVISYVDRVEETKCEEDVCMSCSS